PHARLTDPPPLSLRDALPISRPAQERPPPAQGGYGDEAASAMAGAGSWVSCPMSATDFRDLRKRFYRRGVGIHTARDSPTAVVRDRKSTRLNSSHVSISYAVF